MKVTNPYRKTGVTPGRRIAPTRSGPTTASPLNGKGSQGTNPTAANRLETLAYQNPGFTACRQIVKLCLDHKGKILSANRDAEAIYGIKANKLKGLSIFMFIHPDDVGSAKSRICQPHHTESDKMVFIKNRHISNQGEIYFMSWIVTLHYDKYGELHSIDKTATGIMPLGRAGEDSAPPFRH